MNVDDALSCLNSLLPLKARQDMLPEALRELHRYILASFAASGRPPGRDEIAGQPGIGDVDAALRELADGDLVVLDASRREVSGAYPFTREARLHEVEVNGHTVHAMCALDAVSVAPMFAAETRIRSRCHVTATPVEIRMHGREVVSALPADVHIGIRWQGTSGCAAKSLCMEMVFLADAATASAWRADDPDNISVFNLADAIDFGAAFFVPLLDPALSTRAAG